MCASYFDQFNIINILFGLFTNSSLMLIVAIFLTFLFFKNEWLIPSRWQVITELIYSHWTNLIKDSLGTKGIKYFPFILGLFSILVWLNILGLLEVY